MNRFDGSYVLAGYDGSPESELALRWAAEDARARRLPLHVCHTWHWPYPVAPSGVEALEAAREAGRRLLDHGAAVARQAAPQVEVRSRLAAGPASAILIDESEGAAMAFVGAHGAGGFEGLAAGSTAVQLAAYGACPVVAVRGLPAAGRPVVVGVDGSPASGAALAFAFEEAALHGRPLRAIFACWEPEAITSAEMGMLSDPEQLRKTGATLLERAVCPWREKYPYVEVETRPVMRTPRHALLEAAEDAGLVVVGNRGLGDVTALRLGAVSHALLAYASCSVAVVRARR